MIRVVLFIAFLLSNTSVLLSQFEYDSTDNKKIGYLIDRNEYLETSRDSLKSVIQQQDKYMALAREVITDQAETILRKDIQLTACRNAPKETIVSGKPTFFEVFGFGVGCSIVGVIVYELAFNK